MILNYGSLNIDHVYHVPHFVQPGETLGATGYAVFAGGKGANQSVALARAGATVRHAGKLGSDGAWLKEKLTQAGVDTTAIALVPGASGHAMIQVTPEGENGILLFGGANRQIDMAHILKAFEGCSRRDTLLLQNEINPDAVPLIQAEAAKRHMRVVVNPAPIAADMRHFNFRRVDTLIVNEVEARQLTGEEDLGDIMAAFAERWPAVDVVLTRGARGVCYAGHEGHVEVEAYQVEAVDTTAAGDTFIGYFLAERDAGKSMRAALQTAAAAAAICVTRPGAMDAIPTREEVLHALS